MYLADLHVHSRYSRATSKSLSIKKLAAWAQIKGIDVIATGDFTHPGWMEEIEKYLIQGENGLLKLRDTENLNGHLEIQIDFPIVSDKVNFILCTEISSIYKKHDKVRKVHNLVFMPSLEKAKEFNNRLEKIGNLASDGRPILGLDSEHLLEMVLNTHENAFLVPAHIWTPWFSLFGSRSGFNSIEECFGSLSSEIFALETGLSSDPPMNWLWSALDRFYLISNSDAHSGEKLGREANLFSGEISYLSIYNALKHRTGEFRGTIEFFPEEGKYHLDGHRKCNLVLDPIDAMKLNNICPVCGKPLTIGVMHRILSLSDRKKSQKPSHAPDFHSLIPLTEILSEIMGKGPKTKSVYRVYNSLIKKFKSEIKILMQVDIEEIKKFSPLLAEGIKRMRQGKVYKEPGFDGQYGKISIFKPKEKQNTHKISTKETKYFSIDTTPSKSQNNTLKFNEKQLVAIKTSKTPTLVIAGPGTGKTRTLIGRIIHLINELHTDPQKILVLTFTQAAAQELSQRVGSYSIEPPTISTLHSLGYEILKAQKNTTPIILDDSRAKTLFLKDKKHDDLWTKYLFERERMLPITSTQLHKEYTEQKKHLGVFDYTDLLEFLITYLKNQNKKPSFEHILVDEIQDLSPIQLHILELLCEKQGKGFFGIGDPNQAIYSFRGGVEDIISSLKIIYPNLEILSLEENYRSTKEIIMFSSPLIQFGHPTKTTIEKQGKVIFYEAASQQMEANWIAKQIKELIGSTSLMEIDQGLEGKLSPSEIAILVRFKGLIKPIKNALNKYGIPCSVPEEINFFEDPQIEEFLEIISKHLQNAKDSPLQKIDIYNLSLVQNTLLNLNIFDSLFFNSENFKKLKSKLQELKDWAEVLNFIALQKEYEAISQRAQKVCITTIHAAKGLEFEAVFLPALEDNIMPFNKNIFLKEPLNNDVKNDVQEEKRLFFVGMTRAKSMLFLSYSKKRTIFGKKFSFPPSPFFDYLPLNQATRIRATLKKKKKIQGLTL